MSEKLQPFRIVEAYHLASTCDVEMGGAVIMRGDRVLATGSGGTAGVVCTEIGGHDFLPCKELVPGPGMGGKSWEEIHRCRRGIPAESNAILQAAREGIPLKGSTIFCSNLPSWQSAEMIVRAGIRHVFVHSDVEAHADAKAVFARATVSLVTVEELKDDQDPAM